ncbi:MAG: hypothetical protein ACTSSP_02790 [Candidatus Asgardarchaeia archaeon]
MGLTEHEKNIALNYAFNGAEFMFIPSAILREMVVRVTEETKDLNPSLIEFLLSGKPIRLESKMIIEYCNDRLNTKNTWLLDRGDIKVVPPRFETKMKENNNE